MNTGFTINIGHTPGTRMMQALVRYSGAMVGRLVATDDGVVWRPRDSSGQYSVPWDEFDHFMKSKGEVQSRRTEGAVFAPRTQVRRRAERDDGELPDELIEFSLGDGFSLGDEDDT